MPLTPDPINGVGLIDDGDSYRPDLTTVSE